MAQSADLGNFHDPAYLRRLNGPTDRLSIRKTSWPLISDNLESCDACPPAAILGHENLETLPSVGARIPRIRLAGDPLCSDLCLGLLPTASLIWDVRWLPCAVSSPFVG